jgi:hypothetical protein
VKVHEFVGKNFVKTALFTYLFCGKLHPALRDFETVKASIKYSQLSTEKSIVLLDKL